MNRGHASADAAAACSEVAIAVVEHAGCYLVGLRPDGVPLGGLWEFPGGKIKAGETPEAAAARECWEETGARIEIVGRFPLTEYAYPHGAVRLNFLCGKLLEPCSAPRGSFRWVAACELAALAFPPANAEVLASIGRGLV